MNCDTPHGEEGHLNICKRDQDTAATGNGRHFRVVAFLPDAEGLYCRVDHKHGARMPTPDEVLLAARKTQGIKGRWRHDRDVPHSCGRSTDVYFARA